MERIEDGTFAPGNQAAKGRGSNKVSLKVKESIIAFLERNVDTIQETFDKVKDKEKLDFIANILPYAAPKLSSVQTENETHLSGGIRISWEEPDTGQDKGTT